MKENLDGASTLSLGTPPRQFAKLGGRTELEKAKAEVARVKAQAAEAEETARKLQASLVKTRRDNKMRLRVTAVLMMTAALIRLGFMATAEPAPAPIQAQTTLAAAVSPTTTAQDATGSSSTNADQTNHALNHLRDAFHAFPAEDQMDLVREINEKHPGSSMACPLVWNDGEPALYVGDAKDKSEPYMLQALNQCANELEKLKAERMAAGHN